MYCFIAGLTVTTVKIVNMALHLMYDKAQIISDSNLKKSSKNLHETAG